VTELQKTTKCTALFICRAVHFNIFIFFVCIARHLYAQPDTVFVDDFYVADSSEGTLNAAIQNVIKSGQLSQTVFKLSSNNLYIFKDIIVILPESRH